MFPLAAFPGRDMTLMTSVTPAIAATLAKLFCPIHSYNFQYSGISINGVPAPEEL